MKWNRICNPSCTNFAQRKCKVSAIKLVLIAEPQPILCKDSANEGKTPSLLGSFAECSLSSQNAYIALLDYLVAMGDVSERVWQEIGQKKCAFASI